MKGMLNLIADYFVLADKRIKQLESENMKLRELLEKSDIETGMKEIERLKKKGKIK